MPGCGRDGDEEGFSHLNPCPEEEASNPTSYFNRSRHMALHAFDGLEQFLFIGCEAAGIREFAGVKVYGLGFPACSGIRAGSQLVVEATSRLDPLEHRCRCNGLPL